MKQPKLLSKPWADTGLKNNIPDGRGENIPAESATYEDGFPQITMTPIAMGGKAPSGKDMNGILNELSAHTVFQNQGGIYKFDSAFAEKIGGYSKGATLINDAFTQVFLSLVDRNKTNFNTQNFVGKWQVISGVDFFVPKTQVATLVQQGIVQLNSSTNSDSETQATTPKAVKIVKDLIDALTRNLGNYIPNSKKSSAINSNSADTVATSAAVKTAYDKGVEARNAAEAAQRTANEGVSKATTAQNTANSAVTKADNAQRAADNANNNANNRVPKTGDTTIVGALRAQHPQLNAGRWSEFQLAVKQGYWRLEVNPNSHDANERRFNMVYANGNAQHYLWFPTIGDSGQTVAYQSWVDNLLNNFINGFSYARSLSPNKIQFRWASNGNLELKIDNTELGYLHNSYKAYVETNVTNGNYGGLNIIRKGTSGNFWARFEALPDRRWKFVTEGGATIHLKNQNGNILLDSDISHATNGTNKAKVASEFALGELSNQLKTVVRKDYSRTIKGTTTRSNGLNQTINVTGHTAVYPDGRIEQIFFIRNVSLAWFGYSGNDGTEHIPMQLWTAMPNKVSYVSAFITKTKNGPTYQTEASEWIPPAWAEDLQENNKNQITLRARRYTGGEFERVDVVIKVEGY